MIIIIIMIITITIIIIIINKYCIDGRIYLNLCKYIQSAAGLKALKSADNGRYLMCKKTNQSKTDLTTQYYYSFTEHFSFSFVLVCLF